MNNFIVVDIIAHSMLTFIYVALIVPLGIGLVGLVLVGLVIFSCAMNFAVWSHRLILLDFLVTLSLSLLR